MTTTTTTKTTTKTDMMELNPTGSASSENLEKRMMCAKPNWQLEVARFVSSICMEEEKEVDDGTSTTSNPESYVMRQKYLRSYKFCSDYGEMNRTALWRTKMWIKDAKKNMQKMEGMSKFNAGKAQVVRRFCRALVAKPDVRVQRHGVPFFYVEYYL